MNEQQDEWGYAMRMSQQLVAAHECTADVLSHILQVSLAVTTKNMLDDEWLMLVPSNDVAC